MSDKRVGGIEMEVGTYEYFNETTTCVLLYNITVYM